MGAGELGTQPSGAEPADRLVVARLRSLSVTQQRDTAPHSQPFLGAPGPRRFGQKIEGIARDARLSGMHRGRDQLGQRPHRHIRMLVLAGLPRGR